MTKKKEFLVRIIKEGNVNIYTTCAKNSIGECKALCPLYKIKGKCSDALQVYIKRMRKIDKLEFLIATM